MQGLRVHLLATHDYFEFGFSKDHPIMLPCVSVMPSDRIPYLRDVLRLPEDSNGEREPFEKVSCLAISLPHPL